MAFLGECTLRFYYFRKSACKLTFDKVLLFVRLRFYTEKGIFKVPVYIDGKILECLSIVAIYGIRE